MGKYFFSLNLFLICLVCASCSDSITKRTRSDVWEANPYIPKPLVAEDYAQLDLETACVLRYKNNDIGYIYFTKADRWHAQYTSSLLSMTNNRVCHSNTVTNGLVRLGREIPRGVFCGNISVHWAPTTTLFFSNDITCAALLPIESLASMKPDFTNSLSWVTVDVPLL